MKDKKSTEKFFTFEELHAIIAALRSEHGCPWDKAQTHETMKATTIEEAYEVNQAVTDLSATGCADHLCEELGDLLLQVLLHSQIAEECGEFTLEDVIDGIARKMIRRHPHVFGGQSYDSPEEQQADWEAIKAKERAEQGENTAPSHAISLVPTAFPALIRSQKVLKKAEKHHLLSLQKEDVFREIMESVVDLQLTAAAPDAASNHSEDLQRQLGKTLFSINKLAVLCGIHSEMALTAYTEAFIHRITDEQ